MDKKAHLGNTSEVQEGTMSQTQWNSTLPGMRQQSTCRNLFVLEAPRETKWPDQNSWAKKSEMATPASWKFLYPQLSQSNLSFGDPNDMWEKYWVL